MSGRACVPRLLLAALVSLAGAASSACGGTSAESGREELAEDLVEETDGALDADTARCVADDLHERFGEDSFRRVLEAAGGDSDDESEVRTEVIDIFTACDAIAPIIDDSP